MFSALSQGSLIHILEKTDGLKYKVGEVIGVTQPNAFGGGIYGTPSFSTTNITLKVKVDGKIVDYPEVPSASNVASYNNGCIILSETKDGLQAQVESILQNSRQVLNNIDSYKKSITDCENILKELNPQFAKDKERDDRIDGLDSKVTSMESKLDKILSAITTKQ